MQREVRLFRSFCTKTLPKLHRTGIHRAIYIDCEYFADREGYPAMTPTKPLYLLFCEGSLGQRGNHPMDERGRWRFVLENVETGARIEAGDAETMGHPDRTSLLAVMRGLEALDQPSRVTLITTNRYVARGLQYGLVEWRENDYCWEHFGSVQPVRNADLWRRIDVALRFHEVQCRWMSQDPVTGLEEGDAREVAIPSEASTSAYRDEQMAAEGSSLPSHPKPAAFPRMGAEIVRVQRASSRSRERTRSITVPLQSESLEMSTAFANPMAPTADAMIGSTAVAVLDEPDRDNGRDLDGTHGIGRPEAGVPASRLPRDRLPRDRLPRDRMPEGGGLVVDQGTSHSKSNEDDRREDYFGSNEAVAVASIALEEPSISAVACPASMIGSSETRLPNQSSVPSMILEARKPWLVWIPFQWVWGLILGLDALLVSCLQCMFLVDPRRDEFRSK
jgi:ribonuclease HI